MSFLRSAILQDIPALGELISQSGRKLSAPYYTPKQIEAITRHVFGVDTQLILDRTYFVIESESGLVACGGWSKRFTLFGGDQAKTEPDRLLDPRTEPARIRAFFVHPSMARRGLGRQLMDACVKDARAGGFSTLELVSTLPGEPLYLACDFRVIERFELKLPDNIRVPVALMQRSIL